MKKGLETWPSMQTVVGQNPNTAHILVVLALGKQSQEDEKFKIILSYIASSSP